MINPATPSCLLTNLAGLSNSLASFVRSPQLCPVCQTTARIHGGECLNCLLNAGKEEKNDDDSVQDFATLLGEIDLPDTDWRLGNYYILEEIGRGGMGVIYRARQRYSRRIVALKRVLSYHGDSRETLERFRREAEAASSLDHPNILPIYEVGEADGLPFFTMKYATGGTLRQAAPLLRNDPRECVRLLAKVTRAVAYAHRQGILHRDLKPDNILLDGLREPMVSDFGLAKWIEGKTDLTRSLVIFGTPGFIAPEQVNGNAAGLKPAADVYSLGAILLDLLTGRPPFLGEHALAVIRQAAENTAPKLRSLDRTLDHDLETICAKSLEREPQARYRSANDLAEDLERWLEGRPIVARPVSVPERVWRWSRRNSKLAATIAACLILGSALGVIQVGSRVARQNAVAAMHSIAVAPLLSLETAQPVATLSVALATSLQRELISQGPAHVALLSDESRSQPPARSIMRGTVRLREGKLRVSLRVLERAQGKILYRRIIESADATNAAPIIARLIASDIYPLLNATTLSGKDSADDDPGWQDPITRELIGAGKAVYERRSVLDHDRAIELFQKATAAQPRSGLAHSYLAEAQSGRGFLTGDQGNFSAADVSVQQALRVAPDSAKSHSALAVVRFREGRFREALAATFNAWELSDTDDPRFANRAADSLRHMGRPDRAAAWYRFSLGKETRPGWNEFSLGDCLADLAADEEAATAYRRASSLYPELPEGWMGLCRLALLQKDFVTARQISSGNWTHHREFVFAEEMAAQVEFFSRNFSEAEKLYTGLVTRDPDGGGTFYGAVSYRSALGRLRLARGDEEEGRRILREALWQDEKVADATLPHVGILYRRAAIKSSLGEREPALEDLRAAVREGWVDYRSLSLDPRFDSIKDDEQFVSLIASLKTRVTELREGKGNQPTGLLAEIER